MTDFIDNDKIFFDKVFNLCKTGLKQEDAYDMVEIEFLETFQRNKYKSFESFKTVYYRFWHNRNRRK